MIAIDSKTFLNMELPLLFLGELLLCMLTLNFTCFKDNVL